MRDAPDARAARAPPRPTPQFTREAAAINSEFEQGVAELKSAALAPPEEEGEPEPEARAEEQDAASA